MCYAKPGPRCSGHMREKLKEATRNHEATPSDETAQALAHAQLAYNKTPEGIKAIRQQASDALTANNVDEGVRLTRQADMYQAERETRLAAHDLLKSEGTASLIDEVLNEGAYINGYDVDLSHQIDPETDEVRIAAVWSVHNPRAMYYQHRDKLSFDPKHRPTLDEAEEMVSDFNGQLEDIPTDIDEVDEYDDPIRYETAELIVASEDEIRDRVAAQVAGALNYDFEGGKEVQVSAFEKLRESIAFEHSTSTAVTEDAVMDLLETWDSLYGD